MPPAPLEIRQDAPSFVRHKERLKKACRNLDADLDVAFEEIRAAWQPNPANEHEVTLTVGSAGLGDAIPGFARRIWKKRVASRDQGKGKRGGLRLIFELNWAERRVTPLLLYLKNERNDVGNVEIKRARQEAGLE